MKAPISVRVRLYNLWEMITSSFWFVPGAITLAYATVFPLISIIDESTLTSVNRAISWIYAGDADAARSVLSTLTGSIITVTGVIFSVTIVALTLASSQFGPRILRNFMRSSTTQIVLGIFVGTFTYCLLVLSSIPESIQQSQSIHLALTIAGGMSVLCIISLIFYIHNAAASIQADNLVANVFSELESSITRIFPEQQADNIRNTNDDFLEAPSNAQRVIICSLQVGYLQAIDHSGLTLYASKHDLYIESQYKPGQFVINGSKLADIRLTGDPPDALEECINSFYLLGKQPTPEQDIEFSIHQLVEIAVRALSPGINDPFTAISCVNYLSAGICQLSRREFPSSLRRDEDGIIRVSLQQFSFPELVGHAFYPIYEHGQSSSVVINELLKTLQTMALNIEKQEHRLILGELAEYIMSDTEKSKSQSLNMLILDETFRVVRASFRSLIK